MKNLNFNDVVEIHNEGYYTKRDVLRILKNDCGIELGDEMLKHYGKIDIIDSGIVIKIKKVSGSVSVYPMDTVIRIIFIKYLQKFYGYSLDELKEFFKLINFKDTKKLVSFFSEENYKKIKNFSLERLWELEDLKEFQRFEKFALLYALLKKSLLNFDRLTEIPKGSTLNLIEIDKNSFELVANFEGSINDCYSFEDEKLKNN
jgi:hypothetical protein